MYKDKDKQREANRQAQAKFKAKGITKGITSEGITDRVLPLCPYCLKLPIMSDNAISCEECSGKMLVDAPKPKRGKDIENWDDLPISEQKALLVQGCVEDIPSASPILEPKVKRGKDIKCFEDLSADVQQTIDMMAMIDGKIDKTIKANRTAIAINYQRLFPNRYHSTGIA